MTEAIKRVCGPAALWLHNDPQIRSAAARIATAKDEVGSSSSSDSSSDSAMLRNLFNAVSGVYCFWSLIYLLFTEAILDLYLPNAKLASEEQDRIIIFIRAIAVFKLYIAVLTFFSAQTATQKDAWAGTIGHGAMGMFYACATPSLVAVGGASETLYLWSFLHLLSSFAFFLFSGTLPGVMVKVKKLGKGG